MNIIALSLFVALLVSIWQLPSATPVLGIAFILFSSASAIYSIFKKYKQDENHRSKSIKDILVLISSLLLILFLGGVAGLLANHYANLRFGVIAGFVFAIAVSFAVGYLVKRGVGRLSG